MIKHLSLIVLSALLLSACFHTPSPVPAPQKVKTYSLEEVSTHDNRNDCWIAIDGKVYDITDFISNHPGGNTILEGCGKDATILFETRPMGSGTPHSQVARNLREQFLIGNLSE